MLLEHFSVSKILSLRQTCASILYKSVQALYRRYLIDGQASLIEIRIIRMKRVIRSIEIKDEKRWRELWDGYCQFYKMSLSDENIRHLWNRIQDQNSPVFAICSADDKGNILGLAHYVVHESTSELNPICCLQDLFVDPTSRKSGIGRELIEWLLIEMNTKGWSRVYWHTRENNYKARALYDKFTSLNDFLRYVVKNPVS